MKSLGTIGYDTNTSPLVADTHLETRLSKIKTLTKKSGKYNFNLLKNHYI